MAVTSDGFFQTDVVSVLSIAKAVDAVAFLTLMSHTGDNITLTASHHLSVGAACCATLKPADAVEVGETIDAVGGPFPRVHNRAFEKRCDMFVPKKKLQANRQL